MNISPGSDPDADITKSRKECIVLRFARGAGLSGPGILNDARAEFIRISEIRIGDSEAVVGELTRSHLIAVCIGVTRRIMDACP